MRAITCRLGNNQLGEGIRPNRGKIALISIILRTRNYEKHTLIIGLSGFEAKMLRFRFLLNQFLLKPRFEHNFRQISRFVSTRNFGWTRDVRLSFKVHE